jgi:hypothetical protein
VNLIATLAVGAFDAKHVELAFDVAEDQIRSGHLQPHIEARMLPESPRQSDESNRARALSGKTLNS